MAYLLCCEFSSKNIYRNENRTVLQNGIELTYKTPNNGMFGLDVSHILEDYFSLNPIITAKNSKSNAETIISSAEELHKWVQQTATMDPLTTTVSVVYECHKDGELATQQWHDYSWREYDETKQNKMFVVEVVSKETSKSLTKRIFKNADSVYDFLFGRLCKSYDDDSEVAYGREHCVVIVNGIDVSDFILYRDTTTSLYLNTTGNYFSFVSLEQEISGLI